MRSQPQRVAVLLNAWSEAVRGEGQDRLRGSIEAAFAQHRIEARLEFVPGPQLEAGLRRASLAVERNELDAVVVAGGDGSIGTAANVLAGTGIPLGIVPLGKLNHFAKDLRLPLSIEDAVAAIAAGEVRDVDVAEVNGRIFVNNSSIGIYPFLVVHREWHRRRSGLSKWPAMFLACIRALRFLPIHRLVIQSPAGVESWSSPCVFVGNNRYVLSGTELGGRDRLDEGKLCLHVARQQSVPALLWLACRSVLGILDEKRDLRTVYLPALNIGSGQERLLLAFDGEVELARPPLAYRMRPGALRVFAPAGCGS